MAGLGAAAPLRLAIAAAIRVSRVGYLGVVGRFGPFQVLHTAPVVPFSPPNQSLVNVSNTLPLNVLLFLSLSYVPVNRHF